MINGVAVEAAGANSPCAELHLQHVCVQGCPDRASLNFRPDRSDLRLDGCDLSLHRRQFGYRRFHR
jgi:hypothetical protein